MPEPSQNPGHSFSIPQQVNCPSCGREFEADLWLIVDAAQRLDLVERIRAGQLHALTCPHCGEAGQSDAPLLVFRPGIEPPLLFSPASETNGQQDQEHAIQLVGTLRQSLGAVWRDDWVAQGLHGVSRDALPALLSDDPEAALAELQQRAAAEFERLRQQDPERFRQLQEQAAQEAMSRASPLRRNLAQFLESETWADSQRIVAESPDLLGDEADEMLGQLVEAARGQGDDRAAGHFQEHRDLLRRCGEAGVARAFAEKMLPPEALARAEAEGLAPEELLELSQAAAQMPPELREILAELAAGGVEIRSPEDLERALAARPELQAKLVAAMQQAGGGPDVPAEFRTDVQQAQEGEQRYVKRGDAAGLDAAAAAWERIVEHPGFVGSDARFQLGALNDAGGVFLRRYWAHGRQEDLNRALALWRQAVQRTPPDSPDLPSRLNNLGNGLSSRYARTGRLEDLEEAIRVYQQAVQRTPPDSPDLPGYLNNLGNGLSDRYARTGRLEDLEEGRAAYERACEAGVLVAPAHVIVSGRSWGNWASERVAWREAATAYDHAFRAIDRLLRVQLLRSGWEAWLRETQGLAGRAAYALARDGRLEDAVVVLERGRVRLLSESLEQNRRDLERLPELGHGHLLERYRQTIGRIQSLQQQAGEAGGLQATLRQAFEDARQALDAAIEAIRQVGGYEDFLLPPSFEKIRRAVTAAAPLVYLVTTPQGSLALIASEHGTGTARPDRSQSHVPIELLWLDGFREEDLNRLLLEQADDEVTGGYLPGQLGRSDWLQASLEKILPLLAEKLMGPVAERLRGNGDGSPRLVCGNAAERTNEVPSGGRDAGGGRDLPRIVLIPTGRLSLLPLHATIVDEFTVSYAASAMALAVARDTARTRSGGTRRLAGVGNPLPAAERLRNLRDALRAALSAVPETAELAQPRAELARLLDFPVNDLMHQGRFLITLAVQIYAAAGKPAQRLLGLALQWPASLPHARAELESIADLLPDGHSGTLYEHEAGRQPLLDALAGANLVHLSCHGQFQPSDPLESGLLLADGQLTLGEILAPGFRALDSARLAVLSACQTAIADFRNLPDEAIGLPAGLTQAGVPSVVGTLWSVHDASTALLMVRFYELLLQDKLAPPEALRRAQCWLRDATNSHLDAYLSQQEAFALARQQEAQRMPPSAVHTLLGPVLKGDPNDRPYAHPYFWAPFVFYGAEEPIVKD